MTIAIGINVTRQNKNTPCIGWKERCTDSLQGQKSPITEELLHFRYKVSTRKEGGEMPPIFYCKKGFCFFQVCTLSISHNAAFCFCVVFERDITCISSSCDKLPFPFASFFVKML